MTFESIVSRRLNGHHLLVPSDPQNVLRDLCGVQAQYLSNALHALHIRSISEMPPADMMKNWTIRGTMHLFHCDDLPLMLHRDRTHFLRPCDTLGDDEWICAERKRIFANLIEQSVREGISDREKLKEICTNAGMTPEEGQSIFNPWGGMIRALCEAGRITHAVEERKAFIPCPAFMPMEKEEAQLELARRYFTHYGPATIRDAAYFFASAKRDVMGWLDKLPVQSCVYQGRTLYWIESERWEETDIPECLFLAGFDPLMLGYEKRESLHLKPEHIRGVFSLSGIVMPAVLLHGVVAGKWKRNGRKLRIMLFTTISKEDRAIIVHEAERLWSDVRCIFE